MEQMFRDTKQTRNPMFNKFEHSLQTKTRCYSGKKVLDGFMGCFLAARIQREIREIRETRINEIISTAKSSPRKRVPGIREPRLVFIRRLDRHKFSTIGLAIFSPFETFISAERAQAARRSYSEILVP